MHLQVQGGTGFITVDLPLVTQKSKGTAETKNITTNILFP